MGVPYGHRDRLVPRKFLSCSQIDSGHDQSTDERVAQCVPCEVRHLCVLNYSIKPSPRIVKIPTIFRLKDPALMRPICVQFFECLHAGFVHWYLTAAPVFRLVEKDALTPERDLTPLQTVLLALSHSRIQGNVELRQMPRATKVDSFANLRFLLGRKEAEARILLWPLLYEPEPDCLRLCHRRMRF